jgi:hypothetical protein
LLRHLDERDEFLDPFDVVGGRKLPDRGVERLGDSVPSPSHGADRGAISTLEHALENLLRPVGLPGRDVGEPEPGENVRVARIRVRFERLNDLAWRTMPLDEDGEFTGRFSDLGAAGSIRRLSVLLFGFLRHSHLLVDVADSRQQLDFLVWIHPRGPTHESDRFFEFEARPPQFRHRRVDSR